MSSNATDIDPYAELDNRADAAELSEEFRPPAAVYRRRPASRITTMPRHRRP